MKIIFEEPDILHIHGRVSNIDEYGIIKQKVDSLQGEEINQLEMVFHDTLQIPSVLIGYLIKVEKVLGIHLVIHPHEESLYTQMMTMKLDMIFEIQPQQSRL